MIKRHRTFQRFIAALVLLSFAAMFGAAYLPEAHHDNGTHVTRSHEIAKMQGMHDVASDLHDCCDRNIAGNGVEEQRCSVDCSYYLASNEHALLPSSSAFEDREILAMFFLRNISLLRPPIA